MRHPRSRVPASPERSAELRRRFAEEARSERPDPATLCLLVGAARRTGRWTRRVWTPRRWSSTSWPDSCRSGRVRRRPGRRRCGTCSASGTASTGSPRTTSGSSRRCCTRCCGVGAGCRSCCRWCGWRWPGGRGRRCTGSRCRGTSWSGSGRSSDRRRGGVLADPFDGGRVLSGNDAEVLVAGVTGAALRPSMLEPAAPLEVVSRIPEQHPGVGGGPAGAVGCRAVGDRAGVAAARACRGAAAVRAGSVAGAAGEFSAGARGSWRRTRRSWGRWTRRSRSRSGEARGGSRHAQLRREGLYSSSPSSARRAGAAAVGAQTGNSIRPRGRPASAGRPLVEWRRQLGSVSMTATRSVFLFRA